MRIVAALLFVVLTVIAALHAYWAFGGLWPASSERELIDTVIGDPRATAMPSASSTMVVASMIFAGALVAVARLADWPLFLRLVPLLGCWVLAAVFLGRGAFTYLVEFGASEWPYPLTDTFASLDRTLYAPLCLAIGIGFVLLALRRPR